MINPNDITTVRVDELPPDSLHLTDLFPFETSDQFLKKATISELIAFIALQTSALQFEVKRMSVTQSYIDDNFDVTGLGINICAGFAICNGQNGTENVDGLVGVGFGAVQSNIGGFGGFKEQVLTKNQIPLIDVVLPVSDSENSGGTHVYVNASDLEPAGTKLYENAAGKQGVVSAVNNMQPYIVQLYMMKL